MYLYAMNCSYECSNRMCRCIEYNMTTIVFNDVWLGYNMMKSARGDAMVK